MNAASGLMLATVLPESILGTHWFAVLSTFVAVNTILYVSMSVFKILPKPYLSDFVRRHGRRAETRSIFPNGHGAPDEGTRRVPMAVAGEPRTTIDQELVGSPAAEVPPPRPVGGTTLAEAPPVSQDRT
ncbi:MAG: hypothetical protein U5R31_15325 [Acidimicrobiia bacterium]|nr:hypothetical protein [Acidimicrobiia bacterium]